jgi:Sushi repeat (SCR repeat)
MFNLILIFNLILVIIEGGENILSCGLPGRPVNGLINGSKFDESESFPAGTEVQFSCVESYQILKGAAVRTCMEDGTWSGLRPWCGKFML